MWVHSPDYQIDQESIDQFEAEKSLCEEGIADVKDKINTIISQTHSPRIGQGMIFVDLVGVEY